MLSGAFRALRRAAFAVGVVVVAACGPSLDARDAAAQSKGRAWLGVELGKDAGGVVVVKHVVNGSPASKAGVAEGDQVLQADGMAVGVPADVVGKIALIGPGANLSLRVKHGATQKDLTAALAQYPGDEAVLRMDKLNTFAPEMKSPTGAFGTFPASLASLRGRVVVLDFWATWCGPCRMMSPTLSSWQTSYGAQGLTVIGLTNETVQVASQGAQAWGMTYAVARDPNDATRELYKASSLPTLFVLDKKGVIREIAIGYDAARNKDLEKLVKKLLAEPAPSP